MSNGSVDIARELLLRWMACGERKRSYESIRKNCEYLDQSYGLGLDGYAMWVLFQPLFRTGVAEFAGKDCYALSPSVAIERDGLFIYNSPLSQKDSNGTPFSGIYRTGDSKDIEGMAIVNFDAETVLRSFPSVKDVTDSFPVPIEDLSHAEYYHFRGKKGLTKRLDDGAVRYFCIPETLYQREVPGRSVNPDAFSIAYCYSRSINGETAGKYDPRRKILRMSSFGLPASLERILFLESMTLGHIPEEAHGYNVFPGISPGTVKQMNRILCNTIENE